MTGVSVHLEVLVAEDGLERTIEGMNDVLLGIDGVLLVAASLSQDEEE